MRAGELQRLIVSSCRVQRVRIRRCVWMTVCLSHTHTHARGEQLMKTNVVTLLSDKA